MALIMCKKYCFIIALIASIIFLSGCLQNESKQLENLSDGENNISPESHLAIENSSLPGSEMNKTQLIDKPKVDENAPESCILDNRSLEKMAKDDNSIYNEPVQNPEKIFCIGNESGTRLSLVQALKLASNSECKAAGKFNGTYFCDKEWGYWYLDIDMKQNACCYVVCSVDAKMGDVRLDYHCKYPATPAEMIYAYMPCDYPKASGEAYLCKDAITIAKISVCPQWGELQITQQDGCQCTPVKDSLGKEIPGFSINIRSKEGYLWSCLVNVKEKTAEVWGFKDGQYRLIAADKASQQKPSSENISLKNELLKVTTITPDVGDSTNYGDWLVKVIKIGQNSAILEIADERRIVSSGSEYMFWRYKGSENGKSIFEAFNITVGYTPNSQANKVALVLHPPYTVYLENGNPDQKEGSEVSIAEGESVGMMKDKINVTVNSIGLNEVVIKATFGGESTIRSIKRGEIYDFGKVNVTVEDIFYTENDLSKEVALLLNPSEN